MTYWDFVVGSLTEMREVGELRIRVGFWVAKLGDKELNCVSQLFPHAKEVGIIARSEEESEWGAMEIWRRECIDPSWAIVHMVADDEDYAYGRWHVNWDCWFEGRY